MADTPDIWPTRWPDVPARTTPSGVAPVRPIGGRTPRFGVAHELDAAPRGTASGGDRAAGPRLGSRVPVATPREGVGARVSTWWACREVHPVDLWHRVRCRFGRHRIEGGQRIQLGARFVNTERCCVWCRAKPDL